MLNLPVPAEGRAGKARPTAPNKPPTAFQGAAEATLRALSERGVEGVLRGEVIHVPAIRGTVAYYPRSGGWQFRGKSYSGGLDKFLEWRSANGR
jgi:hypothetical protein